MDLKKLSKKELTQLFTLVFNKYPPKKSTKKDIILILTAQNELMGGGAFTDFLRNTANKTFNLVKNTYNSVKNKIKPIQKIEDSINSTFNFRKRLTNESNNVLQQIGNKKIESISVIRTPVQKTLVNVLDALSFGYFKSLMDTHGFDKFFHLALLIMVDGKYVVVEKLAEINVSFNYKTAYNETSETLKIDNSNIPNLTINEMLEKTKNFMGETKFYDYHAFTNNCQNFIMSVLTANNLQNDEIKDFVFQDIEALHKELEKKASYLSPFTKFTTRMGAFWNKLTGKGIKEISKKEFPLNYGIETEEIIDSISFDSKNVSVLGSSAIKSTLYPSDFDLYEVVKVKNMNDLVDEFQFMISELVKMKNIYIGDIKAGEYKDFEVLDKRAYIKNDKVIGYNSKLIKENITKKLNFLPKSDRNKLLSIVIDNPKPLEFLDIQEKLRFHILRWTVEEILNGYKVLDNNVKITLEDALKTEGLFKLDVLGFTHNKFMEFSIIYELRDSNNKRLNNFRVNVKDNLKSQIKTYQKQGEYFKSLKREYSMLKYDYQYDSKNEKLLPRLKQLASFFNGEAGIIYSVINDILAILQLYDMTDRIPTDKIINTINSFIYRLSNVYSVNSFLKYENTILTKLRTIIKNPDTIEKNLRLLNISLKDILNATSLNEIKS